MLFTAREVGFSGSVFVQAQNGHDILRDAARSALFARVYVRGSCGAQLVE